MNLRSLNIKDAPYMLEWMHDEEICSNFRTDFSKMTNSEVESFILNCSNNNTDIHFAIVDDFDEYLGTISMKNIDFVNRNAEYAIVLRKKAIGKGVANWATHRLFEIAFLENKFHRIYLNVYADNIRANKFYKKIGFDFEGTSKDCLVINGKYKSLNWYAKIGN